MNDRENGKLKFKDDNANEKQFDDYFAEALNTDQEYEYKDEDEDDNGDEYEAYTLDYNDNLDIIDDSEEFTSFISSGYGSRSTSTVPADELMDSLHLNIPELETVLSSAPKSGVSSRGSVKMTELGFKMSRVIMSSGKSKSPESTDNGLFDLESGDALVDNYGMAKKRQRTGKRGRPKGSTKNGTQFGRSSSTHALPPNVSALMGQANVAYVQKQYPRAIELYLQVVQRAPSSPEPYYSLGLVCEEQEDYERAASYFLLAAHLQGRADGELWRRIASLLVRVEGGGGGRERERKEQAIYCLTRAIKAASSSSGEYTILEDLGLFWLRAKLQFELAHYRSVITGFGVALRLLHSQEPSDMSLAVQVAKLSMRMSLAYVAVGMYLSVFRSVVGAGLPLSWSHLNILVELAEVDGDDLGVIEAIEEFALPCYLNSGCEQGQTGWMLLSKSAQLKRALESSDMPVELKIKLALSQIKLGRECSMSGDGLMALLRQLELRRMMKLKIAVGDALLALGNPMQAVQVWLECIEADDSLADSELCMKIGQGYRRAGELSMAVESFLAVLQVEPEHRGTRFALSEAYRSMGRVEEALQILPKDGGVAGKEEDSRCRSSFIDWKGVDELFIKIIGVGLNCAKEDEEDEEDEEDDKFSSSSSGSSGVYKLPLVKSIRFGPERQKRLNNRRSASAVMRTSVNQLRSAFTLLNERNDLEAGSVLLQYFSERGVAAGEVGGGLSAEEWSRSLFKVIVLQAGELCRGGFDKLAWQRLVRVYRSILAAEGLKSTSLSKWRLLGLLLAESVDENEELILDSIKGLIGESANDENGNGNGNGVAVLSAVYMKSERFARAFHHPITFRFLSRLNRRLSHRHAVISVLLGHQSLITQNYDEAVRLYGRAMQVKPEWRWFLELCVGNGLLGRAFQRTCPNQPAKLIQAIIRFFSHLEEALKGANNENIPNTTPSDTNNNLLLLLRHRHRICQSRFNLARALHQSGFLSQAVKYYQQCLGDRMVDGVARYNLSRIYLQSGQPGMARRIMTK